MIKDYFRTLLKMIFFSDTFFVFISNGKAIFFILLLYQLSGGDSQYSRGSLYMG